MLTPQCGHLGERRWYRLENAQRNASQRNAFPQALQGVPYIHMPASVQMSTARTRPVGERWRGKCSEASTVTSDAINTTTDSTVRRVRTSRVVLAANGRTR